MHCPSCGFENPKDMKFCGQCAAALSRSCAQCGFENPPEFAFCGQCGAALSTEPQKRASSEAERRHLTVMFCDQVDSVGRSARLDPEEFREITRQYQELCDKVIQHFGGYIGQYQGDGLLVYFGYPLAHEDDAQRAVRAGLSILAQLPLLNARLRQTCKDVQYFPLQLRIGIHSGEAVVGEMGTGERREVMVLGDVPNLASRLQGIAAPNTVMISETTHRLAGGFLECRELELQKVKGVGPLILAYQAIREREGQSRFEATMAAGLTPLIGRRKELGFLLERWGQVKEGEGCVVMLSGEAGIGKSRLLQELREQGIGETYERLEWHCSPYHQNSAFYPVIGLLQRLLNFQRDDSPQEQLCKLEAALERADFSLPETVPLFASLLSLPLSASHFSFPTLTSQRQRQKILETSLAWLLRLAQQQPVLLVVEDLQWIDPSTLELLSLFIDQGPTARILTLLTFRPDLFSPPWATRSHLMRLTLSRLPRKQAEVMVEKVAGDKTLPAEVLRQLVDKTDGVPLFVEELTKMVLESGLLREREHHYELVGPLPPLAIPATLHDSLIARLDRLGAIKETAQLAATLGREFTYELIHAISPVDEAVLQQALARLAEAELLYQRGLPPQARYIFKHALIQEAAYQSLLKSKRQQFHQQIAHVLEECFPEIREAQPELLAHHYTAAGRIGEAIPYWQKAGRRAVERSAHAEAISHLTRGLELLKVLPDTEERAQQELTLHLALGGPLIATKGYGAPEVEKAYARAFELCRQSRETPYLLQAQQGLAAFYSMRGQFQRARQLGEQCLFLAQQMGDPSRLLQAQWTLGQTLFHIGEFLSAREHVEHALALYDPRHHRSRAVQDLGVTSHSYLSWGLWLLGYPDQALATSHTALTLAQGLSHSFSLAFALIFAAGICQFRGEGRTAQELAEKAIVLCQEQGFPVWLAFGLIARGWALAGQGREEEGIAQMRQGLTAWKATGAEASRPLVLALLAEAHGRVGQVEEGLNMLEEALTIAHGNEELYFEAELHRLKGELTLQQSRVKASQGKSRQVWNPESEAEEYFRQAIEIARHQSMKSLELRAVMSLSRLWRQQDKTEEARQMLAKIYGWFTEGFNTVDLKTAKALLEQFSRNPFEQTPAK